MKFSHQLEHFIDLRLSMNVTYQPMALKGTSYDKMGYLGLDHDKEVYPLYSILGDDVDMQILLQADYIGFHAGADDISTRTLSNGLYILRSCDTGRAYVKTPDGTIYITDPYYIWDKWQRQENPTLESIDPNQIYAKGYIKDRKITITHLATKVIKHN
jgi:hypothetical protein